MRLRWYIDIFLKIWNANFFKLQDIQNETIFKLSGQIFKAKVLCIASIRYYMCLCGDRGDWYTRVCHHFLNDFTIALTKRARDKIHTNKNKIDR